MAPSEEIFTQKDLNIRSASGGLWSAVSKSQELCTLGLHFLKINAQVRSKHPCAMLTFCAPYKFDCTQMLLSATSASGGFPISHAPIQTHPCPRICNQPY